MLERVCTIPNPLGMHARASAQLVRLAQTFRSDVTIKRCDTGATVDAKSILSLLGLAAGYGIEVKVAANGLDERRAVESIALLIESGFGEM